MRQSSEAEVTTNCSGGPDLSASDGESEEEWFCGDCGRLYEDETEEPEIWIECGLCSLWFHCSCEGLSCLPPIETNYICLKCQE